jgi:hypothetical protein
MVPALAHSLFEATFRASPAYDLMVFDRLPQYQQELLADLRNDPAMYGVIFPRESAARSSKAVDRDTALLIFTLQTPGRLPSYVRALLDRQDGEDIARLVLDGILEIECDGAFLSGADAYPLLYGIAPLPEAAGVPTRLSRAALQYAQALPIDDPMKLAARLYFYNRRPFTAMWRRQFPTQEAVDRFLGLDLEHTMSDPAYQHWTRISAPAGSKGWHAWRSRRARREADSTYKLYVSPDHACMAEAWRSTIGILAGYGAHMIKIGCDIQGMLRPDKIVAYFGRFADLEAGAAHLQRELAGCAAHGVPFTAALGADGLLSWGTDPPRDQQVMSWQSSESWRVWVCHRLAAALVLARGQANQLLEPWRFAMERVQLEGVDVATWTPAATIWQASQVSKEE